MPNEGRKEGNVLFNDALNTFYLRLYGVRHMVKDHSDSEKGNLLPPHSGYSVRLTARVLLYAPSHRQDSTYHGLCYTSRGALAGTRNISMIPPHEGSIRRPFMSERSYHGATSRSMPNEIDCSWVKCTFQTTTCVGKSIGYQEVHNRPLWRNSCLVIN